MERDADPGGLGPSDSRAPSEVGNLAESETKCTSSEWYECTARTVEEFIWRGFDQVAESRGRSGSESRRVWSGAELHAAVQRAKEGQKPMQRSSQTPDARVAEARVKVSKLEKALDALEGTSGAEVEAIKKALVKAKAAAHEKPLTELIADCKGFIDRAEKRLVKLEAERASETALLEEGRARRAHLGCPSRGWCRCLLQHLQNWKQRCLVSEKSWPVRGESQTPMQATNFRRNACARISSRTLLPFLLKPSVAHAQGVGGLQSSVYTVLPFVRKTNAGKGWHAMETPSGWYEVIRGPRPLSVRWPQAHVRQPPGGQPFEGRRGRWRSGPLVRQQPKDAVLVPPRKTPEEFLLQLKFEFNTWRRHWQRMAVFTTQSLRLWRHFSNELEHRRKCQFRKKK